MTRSMVGFCPALVALCVLSATGAGATDWVVNTTLDLPDANAGNGVCATSGGQCSLRAAIEESNAQGGSHTVTLSFGFYNLTHTSGTDIVGFQVTADVEIYGAGILSTAIDGSSSTQIFSVETGARLRLESMIVRNGKVLHTPGACIANDGTLEMESVFMSGCDDEGGSGGGAITNFGSFTGRYVIFHANHSGGVGPGLDNRPGATASLLLSSFSENVGGPTILNSGVLTLADVTVRDGGDGGAIFNNGTATLERVTVSGNHSTSSGGGIDNRDPGQLTMSNSTISDNSADQQGGGMVVGGNGATVSLTHVTFSGNTDSGTAAAIWAWGSCTVELVNTLITSGGATNCSYGVPFTSHGHNLEDLNTCGLGATGDQVNTTPLLGPLQDNGGWTHTRALLPGSPGIDDGDGTLGVLVDQRGWARPGDGDGDGVSEVDIGAFEVIVRLFADGFNAGNTNAWSDTVP